MQVISSWDEHVDALPQQLPNDGSIMFKISGAEQSMLFCADVEEVMEQYIIPELADHGPDLTVESATEEEVDEIAGCFVKPFRMDGSPMIRCRIFRTERRGVILFDVWHAVCDGESLDLLFEEVGR